MYSKDFFLQKNNYLVCIYACVCVRACVRACVRVCVCEQKVKRLVMHADLIMKTDV